MMKFVISEDILEARFNFLGTHIYTEDAMLIIKEKYRVTVMFWECTYSLKGDISTAPTNWVDKAKYYIHHNDI